MGSGCRFGIAGSTGSSRGCLRGDGDGEGGGLGLAERDGFGLVRPGLAGRDVALGL